MSVVPFEGCSVRPEAVEAAIRPDTRLMVMTHGSKVLGSVQDIRRIGETLHDHGVYFIVDGAQTAGHIPVALRDICRPPGDSAWYRTLASPRPDGTERGLEVVRGRAECLPIRNGSCSSALLIAVLYFLDDPPRAFWELARFLAPEDVLVVGFLDREGAIVERCLRDKGVRRFLSRARFYSSGEVPMLLETGGFRAVTVRSRADFGIITAREDESVPNEMRKARYVE